MLFSLVYYSYTLHSLLLVVNLFHEAPDSTNTESSDSQQVDSSSPGAFAAFGKTLRCTKNCCSNDTLEESFESHFPGIRMAANPIVTSSDTLKKDNTKNQSNAVPSSSRSRPRATQLPPDPRIRDGQFKSFVGVTICHCGIHMHTFTCKKPPKGWHGCRLCFPKALSDGSRPIEIAPSIQPLGNKQWDELDPYGTEYIEKKVDLSTQKIEQEYVKLSIPDPEEPERYTTKEHIYPLKSDSSRTIIWELNRPQLKKLDELDDGMTKEDIILKLCEEMMPGENSSVFRDASSRLAMEQIDLHCFDKDDKNNLFFTLLLGLIESSRLKAGKKSVQCIRSELMGHLRTKGHKYKFDESDTSTVAQYIESRMDVEHVTEDTIEQYIQLMENVTGDDCFEGGELEIRLFAEMEKLNVAIYEEEVHTSNGVSSNDSTKDVSYKQVEFFGTDENDRTTIHLLRQSNNSGSNSRQSQRGNIKTPEYHYTLMTSKLNGVKNSLQAFDLYDLNLLYDIVSKSLEGRNGLVVDFNPYLTSLLGCNSNLLYLGSSEQSKSALFYIGPYINKDGVKITDALPILMKAHENAVKYPSIAEDCNTTKRHAQLTLTRVVNKMNGLIEVSDTQIAASLLSMGASLCSDSFVPCDINAYQMFIEAELRRTNRSFEASDLDDLDEDKAYYDESDILLDDNELQFEHNNESVDVGVVGGQLSNQSMDCDESKDLIECKKSDDSDSSSKDTIQSGMGKNETEGVSNQDICCITQSDGEEDDGDDFAFINASFGSGRIYKMNDGSKQPVSYAALYRHRGEKLKHLNRLEYASIVSVVETKNNDRSESLRSRGEPFYFGSGIGIEKNYHQILRSKLMIVKFHKNPPAPPKIEPQRPEIDESDEEYEEQYQTYLKDHAVWRKKADKFAYFYLTLFRPEDTLYEKGQVCTYKYDWEAFEKFYFELMFKRGLSFRCRARLGLIDSVVGSWRVDREKREMLAAHRARARTIWTAEEKESHKMFFRGNQNRDDGVDYISDVVQNMTSHDYTNARKQLGQSNAIMTTLRNLNTPTNESNATDQSNSHASSLPKVGNARAVPFDMELDESKRKSKVKSTYVDEDGNVSTPSMHHTIPDLDKKVKHYIKAQDLSADKDIVINIAHDHFKAIRSGRAQDKDYEAPNLLVCGKPGNGKSKIIDSLDGIVEIMKVGEQMKNAYMGSAAVGIRGTTLLKSWNIPVFNKGETIRFLPWNEDELQALKRRFGQNVDNICCVIIDEISTVQPYMLAYLNIRMQTLFNNNKQPFGGRMVILLGDFQQKPPTSGISLPGIVMKYIEEKGESLNSNGTRDLNLSEMGGALFSKFRYIKLTTQHRSGDPKHMAVINKMSNTGVITVEDLKDNYKALSAEDMASDDFRFATNIVTGNAERREINAWQAKRWAEHHGINTIRWSRKRDEASWKGRPNEASIAHALQNASFWEYFPPNAMGYLNTHNINSTHGLANGTEIKYHSLSFEDKDQRKQFDLKCAQAKPGDIITIDSPPTAINVELFPDYDEDTTSETTKKKVKRKEWLDSGKGSITNDRRVVIPISHRDGNKIRSMNTYIPGCTRLDLQQIYYYDSRLKIRDYFPIEPAFSITVDKAQASVLWLYCVLHICFVY